MEGTLELKKRAISRYVINGQELLPYTDKNIGLVLILQINSCSFKSSIPSSGLVRKQDAKKQEPRPRKKFSFFTRVTECFSRYFDLISNIAEVLKCLHWSWKPGCRV